MTIPETVERVKKNLLSGNKINARDFYILKSRTKNFGDINFKWRGRISKTNK